EGGELSDEPVPPPAGDEPLASDLDSFVGSANQLGFARYQAGDMQGAIGYYLSVLDMQPDEPEALRWLGRIAFEQGDEAEAQTAVNYFGRLVELDPGDESAQFFLRLSRERLAVGVEASVAFRAGIASYEAGELDSALQSFEAAAAAAPEYVDAEVWAGRTALELGLVERALVHWDRVVAARPGDEGAAWFQGLARAQARWGSAAGKAYYEGLAAYEAGDLEAATTSFVAATAANEAFTDAWVWAARSLQESDRPLDSIPYWERVLELEPDDERASWYLGRARTAIAHGRVAGPAYYDAVARYQAGDVDGALELVETAVQADPEFSEAWGLKGRIAFQLQRYDVAAVAYERAAELEPGNDDYAFFAREARMLSEDEGSDEVVPELPMRRDNR
ncbi:MAG TPA: tetratricopeptide repeat protein, partial [Trueperaceae bacterium]|nr:tetratricopeptide repeat protein [Trueperaceae bacterium]